MEDALNKYSRYWGFVFFCTAGVFIAFHVFQAFAVPDILKLQFSDNAAEFYGLIDQMNGKKVDCQVLKNNTYLDFGYILFYSLLFLLSLKVFELSLGFKMKKAIYVAAFIPGLFDVVENIAFLQLVEGDESFFSLYCWTARLKWFFVNVFLLITLTIVLYYALVVAGRIFNFFSKA